jgi:hypothetical protein
MFNPRSCARSDITLPQSEYLPQRYRTHRPTDGSHYAVNRHFVGRLPRPAKGQMCRVRRFADGQVHPQQQTVPRVAWQSFYPAIPEDCDETEGFDAAYIASEHFAYLNRQRIVKLALQQRGKAFLSPMDSTAAADNQDRYVMISVTSAAPRKTTWSFAGSGGVPLTTALCPRP